MADVTETQIDSQFAGGDNTPSLTDPSDIFDQAAVHYFEKGQPTTAKDISPAVDDSDEQNIDEETNATDGNAEPDDETSDNSDEVQSDFQPYSFKGNVFGQEIEENFESPEELNKIISRGLASETLYKKMKEKDTVIQSLTAEAESGREFESLAKEDPEALVDLIFDKYLTEEGAAQKVLKLFEHYRNLSKMTPEERATQKKLKLADELIRREESLKVEREKTEARQKELKVEQQKVEDRNWANYELKRFQSRFQNLDPELVKQQILNVMTHVRYARQQGHEMTKQQATQLLNQYMKPFEKLTSPTETKRRLGETINQKKQQSADTLGNAARQQIQRQAPAKSESNGPIEVHDAFDIIKQKIANGQYTLRP